MNDSESFSNSIYVAETHLEERELSFDEGRKFIHSNFMFWLKYQHPLTNFFKLNTSPH